MKNESHHAMFLSPHFVSFITVCLVARSGEGRRRVISDLVLALGCGQCLVEPTSLDPSQGECSKENAEMWALKAWGELCMGLSAPKSSNAGPSSQDSNSVLSFEVVRLMLGKKCLPMLCTC